MGDQDSSRNWKPQTQLVRGGQMRSPFQETSEALYLTSGFVYASAEEAEAAFINEGSRFVYSRYSNPTVAMFEERLRLLEGAETCRATASGMAAVAAAMLCFLKKGDRVVSSRVLFGSCHWIISTLLPRYGIETVLVDGGDLDAWREALKPGAQAVFFETPSNPILGLVDIAAVSELAHEAGARVIIDNVFATPMLQRPLEHGADIVVYSATKHIDGQGRCMGGAILGPADWHKEFLWPFYKHTGPSMSPFNAWVLLKGLETLDLRVQRHCANALAVAQALADHPKIGTVLYPGLPSHPQYDLAQRQMSGGGNLVSFTVPGGKAGAFRFLNGLSLVDISNNLGDTKSLITHPATTTHRAVPPAQRAEFGIEDGLVRISVGLEDVGDIIADLTTALAEV
ncbi:MAG: O-succinylhomoserine sulfhydrylase [Alphaproteobacteria bacterium]|nr:O-succinylhomoserine sulfhydrylase [Alphaproteobacteria bacterium]MBU0798004.1 O-succinylhomoserine sulfhydrylase [Alphaproteobacteria bacterium]MBU0886220.1 O-succinylhomoserine sulfhydrylase [Alphaproteobacteria bacterium]MBU1814195.1 O-succinylhomoserine sulfhydrylase [Alphaproteobacteria bacterium]